MTSTTGVAAHRVAWSADGTPILDGVTCEFPPGQVTGVLGPNGAGKSTLLRILAGVLRCTSGVVEADGANLADLPRRTRARTLALVEQEAQATTSLTVLDAVLLGRYPHRSLLSGTTGVDLDIAREALARVGAAGLERRTLTTLSGGERQRVHLARALAQEPRVLIADEPTNHLDVGAQLASLGLLRDLANSGVTVITALHDLTLAAGACDNVVLLNRGRVVAAGPVDTVLIPATIDPIYGVHTTVLRHPLTNRPVLTFTPT